MSTATVSVLVPTDDDVAVTLRCLQAIARLPDEPAFEVVIVVPADAVANRDLVQGLEGDVQVVVDEAPDGPGTAFDRAAAVATAPLVVALTASALPADGWLTDLIAPLADAGVAAVLPRSLTAEALDLPEASWLALAVRRDAYLAVGGFSGTRAHAKAEKATLLDGLRDAGHTVATARAAVLLAG